MSTALAVLIVVPAIVGVTARRRVIKQTRALTDDITSGGWEVEVNNSITVSQHATFISNIHGDAVGTGTRKFCLINIPNIFTAINGKYYLSGTVTTPIVVGRYYLTNPYHPLNHRSIHYFHKAPLR